MEDACKQLFNEIDFNNDNSIDYHEFKTLFKKLGINVDEKTIQA